MRPDHFTSEVHRGGFDDSDGEDEEDGDSHLISLALERLFAQA
jgi:hypothetical protein